MLWSSADISGDHKAQLWSDTLHAVVVLVVVASATLVALFTRNVIPTDTLPTIYGSAIGYAAGRAGNIARQRSDR